MKRSNGVKVKVKVEVKFKVKVKVKYWVWKQGLHKKHTTRIMKRIRLLV
jgi:hypothetical protein